MVMEAEEKPPQGCCALPCEDAESQTARKQRKTLSEPQAILFPSKIVDSWSHLVDLEPYWVGLGS